MFPPFLLKPSASQFESTQSIFHPWPLSQPPHFQLIWSIQTILVFSSSLDLDDFTSHPFIITFHQSILTYYLAAKFHSSMSQSTNLTHQFAISNHHSKITSSWFDLAILAFLWSSFVALSTLSTTADGADLVYFQSLFEMSYDVLSESASHLSVAHSTLEYREHPLTQVASRSSIYLSIWELVKVQQSLCLYH